MPPIGVGTAGVGITGIGVGTIIGIPTGIGIPRFGVVVLTIGEAYTISPEMSFMANQGTATIDHQPAIILTPVLAQDMAVVAPIDVQDLPTPTSQPEVPALLDQIRRPVVAPRIVEVLPA